MNQRNRDDGARFAKFLESIPEEERNDIYEKQLVKDEDQYNRFLDAFRIGGCYLCGKDLATFSTKEPCVHGLLKPKGFDKKHIKLIAEHFGVFRIQAYLRWVANQDGKIKNINSLSEDGIDKPIEVTIKYKNLEWSISCSENDLSGHPNSNFGKDPHYHFQMRVNKRQYINYGDFHLPLSKADVLHLEAKQVLKGKLVLSFPFGEGIEEALTEENLEVIVNHTSPVGHSEEAETEEAPFRIQSMVVADEGTKIRGEDIFALLEEAKARGVTFASLLHKLPNSSAQVIVSPGPGVVPPAPRQGGRKKKGREQ